VCLQQFFFIEHIDAQGFDVGYVQGESLHGQAIELTHVEEQVPVTTVQTDGQLH
tara:strand:- start:155 stop:316 length:162 start_codon:yes stop_codon:yes gene_type:complete